MANWQNHFVEWWITLTIMIHLIYFYPHCWFHCLQSNAVQTRGMIRDENLEKR